MEIFRVPRRKVAVRITLDDGRCLDGVLYTSTSSPRGHPESVADRLNAREEEFLPLACGEDRFLLNKSGIIAVEIPDALDGVDRIDTAGVREIPVRFTLAGGTSLLGKLCVSMPPERSRVLDFLNAAPRFIPLLSNGQVTLVHRNYIVSVRSADDEG